MLIQLQPLSQVPIHKQIVSQVIFAIASDGLTAGSLIPSIRELAPRILAHPNTVAKAYQELERRGILAVKRGVGMEVAADAPRICMEQRQEIVREQIREALRAAVCSALPDNVIRQLVEEELHHVNGQSPPPEKRR